MAVCQTDCKPMHTLNEHNSYLCVSGVPSTYLSQFFAVTIPAVPSANTLNMLLQPVCPICLCPTAKAMRSYTKHPPKIQSLPLAKPPKSRPVTTLTAGDGPSWLKYATEPLCRRSRTPIPAKVLETRCVRTEEVDFVFIGGWRAKM